MENVNDEILSEMMVEHLSVPNEFFSLPPLYPEVEDALWEDPDKIIYVCIYWNFKGGYRTKIFFYKYIEISFLLCVYQ